MFPSSPALKSAGVKKVVRTFTNMGPTLGSDGKNGGAERFPFG